MPPLGPEKPCTLGNLASPPFPPGVEVDAAKTCIIANLGLSSTEAVVALAVAAGYSDLDIATARCRSVATVKGCLRIVLQKVGVRSMSGVAAMVVATVWAGETYPPNGPVRAD